jgi:acyl carrier protein
MDNIISERLKKVILSELKLADFCLKRPMHAYQVPGWDSINHAAILCAIERAYGIHFTVAEVLRLKNLGDLQDLVDRKAQMRANRYDAI